MKYVNKFIKENYDRFSLLLPAGSKEVIRERVSNLSEGGYIDAKSINRYIGALIAADLEGEIVWHEDGGISGEVAEAKEIVSIVDDI